MDTEKANQLIKELTQNHQGLTSALAENKVIISEFRRNYYDEEKYPEQADIASVLIGFRKTALFYSDFLKTLDAVLSDKDVMAAIQKIPLAARSFSRIKTEQFLPFYATMIRVYGKLKNSGTSSYLWDQIYQLAIIYGSYGASTSASSSLHSAMPFLTGVFAKERDSKEWENYFKSARGAIKKEYVDGLRFMAERAAFLANTTDEQKLKSSEISWWCRCIDMTPKDWEAVIALGYFLGECPDPTHPDVIDKLKELAGDQRVTRATRESAQGLLKSAEEKFEKSSTDGSQIPATHPPENVLEKFVADLRDPIKTVEDLLPSLFDITTQEEGRDTFPLLTQALLITNRNIALVLEYLHSITKNGITDTADVAVSILAVFTHELREVSAPLAGYVAVCEQFDLSEDELAHFLKYIEISGKPLPKIFKVLEENWQMWLETGNFDWEQKALSSWGSS